MSSELMFSPTSCSYHPCGKRATSAPQRVQWMGTLWPPTGLWMTCTLLRTWASLKTWGESSISSVQIVRSDQSAGTVWMTRKVSMLLWKGWIMHNLMHMWANKNYKKNVLADYASFHGFIPRVDYTLIHHTHTHKHTHLHILQWVHCVW